MLPSPSDAELRNRERRSALGLALGVGLLGVVGWEAGVVDAMAGSDGTVCAPIEEETEGPFPADGSRSPFGPPGFRREPNGTAPPTPNALARPDIVRSDVRASARGTRRVAAGVPLRLQIDLVSAGGVCSALSGRAVYIWHCDRDGDYSLYADGLADEDYLRGVQVSDRDGGVAFDTVFPGCYAGRMPHVHFEVYRSLDEATSYRHKKLTSQIAFPPDACRAVYSTSAGYERSAIELSRTSFDRDPVFSDGVATELATVGGDPRRGMTAHLRVAIVG